GAIYTPIFSGFGPEAVAARVRDCEATMLVTADGFFRRGKLVAMKQVADEALTRCPSVSHMLVVRRAGCPVSWEPRRDLWWPENPDERENRDEIDAAGEPSGAEIMGANDPFMIIYTSGTTGRPKGTVHVHSGFPIKAAQD